MIPSLDGEESHKQNKVFLDGQVPSNKYVLSANGSTKKHEKKKRCFFLLLASKFLLCTFNIPSTPSFTSVSQKSGFPPKKKHAGLFVVYCGRGLALRPRCGQLSFLLSKPRCRMAPSTHDEKSIPVNEI